MRESLRRRKSEVRSIGIMTVLNVGGGVLAVINGVVLANLFGTSRAIEIYFAATTLLTSVTAVTQSGRLSGIFLPVYHELKAKQGQTAAFGALSVVVNWMLLGTLGLCVALWLLAPYVVQLLVPGFGLSDTVQTVTVFRWIVPLVGVVVIRSFFRTQAHAESRFGGPESVTVVERLFGIVVLVALVGKYGMWAVVIAYWTSHVVSLAGYVVLSYGTGYRYAPKLRQAGFRPWQAVFNKMPYTMGYVGSVALVNFVMTAALSTLPPGMLALYKYVDQICWKLGGVLLRPVSLVYFTKVSSHIAEGGRRLRQHADRALARYLAIWAGAFAVIVTSSRPMLTALWGSTKFSGAELGLAARLIDILFLLLVVEMLVWVLERTNLAMQDAQRMFAAKTVVQLATAASAWVLIPNLGIGGAVATLGVRVLGFALVSAVLVWDRERVIILHPLDRVWRWALAVLAGVAAGAGVAALSPLGGLDGRIVILGHAVILSLVSALATYATAWALQVPEMQTTVQELLRIRGRFAPSANSSG